MKSRFLLGLLLLAFSSFSMAGVACLNIQNYDDSTGKKQASIESEYKSQEDPKKDLAGCFANVGGGTGLKPASQECGCKEALKKLCKFSKKKGNFQGDGTDQAACMTFRPLLWPKMTI